MYAGFALASSAGAAAAAASSVFCFLTAGSSLVITGWATEVVVHYYETNDSNKGEDKNGHDEDKINQRIRSCSYI